MAKKTKSILKEKLYEGYLKLYTYDLEIPSLNSKKSYVHVKNREVVHSSDSILVLIYAPAIDSFVLCQEFRVGVFFNANREEPFILECVSGTIDNNCEPEETARREVFEETGLQIDTLKTIAFAYKSPGILTEKTYIYYTEIKDTPNIGLYGVDDEEIMTHIIQREKVYELMDTMKIVDSATLIALNWFRVKQEKLVKNLKIFS